MAKIKHIAFFKFKPGVTDDQIIQAFDLLMEVSESIDGIEDYVWGPNTSPEGLSQGYTHAFVMTFRDAAARDGYLPHPEHDKFKEAALPLLDGAAVVDFEL